MADDRKEIYDDESAGQGFYKRDRGINRESGEARKGSLEEAENEAASGASADEKITQDEAAAGGFSYKPSGSGSTKSFVSKNLKRNLLGGGAIASLAGFALSVFISFLPLKMEYIIQNITASVTAATYQTIENRLEHVMENYITRRLFIDGPGGGPSYQGDTLFRTLYNNWRVGGFEDKLLREHGLKFEALDGNTVVTSNSQTPDGWRLVRDGVPGQKFDTLSIDMDLLDNDLNARDARRVIRQATRETTRWNQILKRRQLRRILVNKYDIPDWKVPDSVRDAQKSYRDRKVAAKKWVIQRTIGPFSARYAAFFTCIIQPDDCGDLLKQSNPDLRSDLPTADIPPEEPVRSDPRFWDDNIIGTNPDGTPIYGDPPQIFNESRWASATAAYDDFFGTNSCCPLTGDDPDIRDKKLADIEGDKLYSRANQSGEVVDDISRQLDSGEALPDGRLARLIGNQFVTKIAGTALLGIGIIQFIAEFDENCVQKALCAQALTDMKKLSAVGAAFPYMTANSHALSGELTAEGYGALVENFDGFEEHPIWSVEYGQLRGDVASIGFGSVLAQSQTIAYDCDDNGIKDEPPLSLDRPVCDHEVIRSDFGSFRDSTFYNLLEPILSLWRSTIGVVYSFFNSIIDAIAGPIVDALIAIAPFPIEQWMQDFIEWGMGKLIGPQCTGAEEGGAAYSCLRAGLEVAYSEVGEEAVNGIGGKFLSDDEWILLQKEYQQQLAWEWQQESLMTRLFSTDSSRSLLAMAIVNTPSNTHTFAQNVASVVTNPLKTIGSMFGSFTEPVGAAGRVGFNPYGIVHYGYPAGDPAITANPETDPALQGCELNVLPESYNDPRLDDGGDNDLTTGNYRVIEDDPSAPLWPVYTTTDPCALERTVVEIGSALFSDESGGLGFDFYEDEGSEFYAGKYDEVFDSWNYAGATQ